MRRSPRQSSVGPRDEHKEIQWKRRSPGEDRRRASAFRGRSSTGWIPDGDRASMGLLGGNPGHQAALTPPLHSIDVSFGRGVTSHSTPNPRATFGPGAARTAPRAPEAEPAETRSSELPRGLSPERSPDRCLDCDLHSLLAEEAQLEPDKPRNVTRSQMISALG